MNPRTACSVAAALLVPGVLSAQSSLFATPSVRLVSTPSPSAVFTISGPPSTPFVLGGDLVPGPATLFGTAVELGLSPWVFVIDAGALDLGGSHVAVVPVPAVPGLAGLVVYSQAYLASPSAPNGVFTASNGESTVLHAGLTAIVDRFDDPLAAGFVGTFDATVRNRLRGTIARRRVQPIQLGTLLDDAVPGTVASTALPFGPAIRAPLDPRGCRGQFVYRARDLGGDGTPEVLTNVYWRLADGQQATLDTFSEVAIRVSHSQVSPRFLIDIFSALPAFPLSGLRSAFATNESSAPVLVRTGPYTIDPSAQIVGLDSLGQGRYLDWGIAPNFVYNGIDSLLVDVRTDPSPTSSGQNGAQVHLTMSSDPLPGARCVALPALPFGVVDPDVVATGVPDNAVHDVVFEFARVEATARSPWRTSGVALPDYQPAVLAASTPGRSAIVISYRGADDALGTNATAFSTDVDVADGKQFVQYSIRLVGDLVTGAVPSVDTLVIPVR